MPSPPYPHGRVGLTNNAARRSATSPTLALTGHVLKVQDLSPVLRRVTLGGEDLAHLGVGGPTLDLRVRLVVPHTGSTAESVQACLVDMRPEAPSGADSFSWYPNWLAHPESLRGVMRTYTVRQLRDTPSGTELTIDVVLHHEGDDASSGPGSRWASLTDVGETVTVVGPNNALCRADYAGIEWRPGSARNVLLAGDESAVPAVLGILEGLAAGPDSDLWQGHVLLEVPSAEDILDATAPPGVHVTWLPRANTTRGAMLAAALEAVVPAPGISPGRAVEDVDVDASILWETSTGTPTDRYAWIAGEAGMLKPLRRWLLGPAGMVREQVAIMGYWREGRSG